MENKKTESSPFCIVVGVDFSEEGDLALSEAIRVAQRHEDAHIHAIHVLTSSEVGSGGGKTKLEREGDALESLPPKVWKAIDRAAARVERKQSTRQISVHIRSGKPAPTIHQVAVDYDADIVIVGTHGRTGLKKVALGSVAENLVRTAHCPVYVVRIKDYSGLPKSDKIDEPHAGDVAGQPRESHVYRSSQTVNWSKPSWLSGGA